MRRVIYDYRKLLGKIKEVCGTQGEFAIQLGIGRTSLNHRLTGKLEFSQDEINRAMDILELPKEEIPTYFFTLKVEKAKYEEGA